MADSTQPTFETMATAIASAFRSERLVYRAFQDNEQDRDFAWRHIASDILTQALGNPAVHKPQSRQASDASVDAALKSSLMYIVICLPVKEGAVDVASERLEPIGTINLREIPMYQRRASFGIQLSPAYQSKGYGFEAVNWVMDWCFRWGGFHSLQLGASLYNERAMAVYKKAGFVLEGINRQAVYRNRRWLDTCQMSILEHEWEALRGINTGSSTSS